MVLLLKNKSENTEKLFKINKIKVNTMEHSITILTKNDGIIDAMCTKKDFEKMINRLLTNLFYERKATVDCIDFVVKEPHVEKSEHEFIYFTKEDGDWKEIVE